MTAWLKRWWAWIAIIAVATLLNLGANYQIEQQIKQTAARESLTNYENAISSCHAGNPVRRGTVLGLKTAESMAAHGNASYGRAAADITSQPYVRSDGSRVCSEAISRP
jgi:hypothetical protein